MTVNNKWKIGVVHITLYMYGYGSVEGKKGLKMKRYDLQSVLIRTIITRFLSNSSKQPTNQ